MKARNKRLIGGCIIGMLLSFLGISIYDFRLQYFSYQNLLIVSGFLVLWYLLCENGEEK